jgi:Cu/Ag efflux protein CusF
MKTLKPLIASIVLAMALPALAEIEAAPSGMAGAELIETTATVEAVDLSSRYVTLKGPQGNVVTVRAGDRIENLDKVKPGDGVKVKYYRSMAVDVLAGAGDASAPERQRSSSVGPGTAPGTAGRQMRSIVKILSVDPYKKAIAFRDPEGRYREVSVGSPELQHFLNELKAGDTVRVTFTDALAVSLEPR